MFSAVAAVAWMTNAYRTVNHGDIHCAIASVLRYDTLLADRNVDIRDVTSIKAQEHAESRHTLAAIGEHVLALLCGSTVGIGMYRILADGHVIHPRGRAVLQCAIVVGNAASTFITGSTVHGRAFTVCDNGRPIGTVRAVIPTWDYVRHGQRVESELVWSGATAMK